MAAAVAAVADCLRPPLPSSRARKQLYQQAQAALKAGDLGTYQAKINELATVIQALQKLVGTPAPTPSGSAQPSASP